MATGWEELSARPHYVYRHLAAGNVLLYVGCTCAPKQRPYVPRPWSADIAEITVEGPFSRVHALEIEEHQIRDFLPPHNKRMDNGSRDRRAWMEMEAEREAGAVITDAEHWRRMEAARAAHLVRYPGAVYGMRTKQAAA